MPTGGPTLIAGFAEKMRQKMGFSFQGVRERALLAGIETLVRELGCTPAELLARLDAEPRVWNAMVEAVTVGETYFFRRPDHFEFIRSLLYQHPGTIRMWSAGCATGEEAYSLAMLALECLGREAFERVSVLATDINLDFLARAQRAVYRPWSFRGLDPARIQRYFLPCDEGYRLDGRLRSLVRFRRLNLMEVQEEWPRGIDVVLCRNVTVYFAPSEAKIVLANLGGALREGGWLLQDATDPVVDVPGLSLEQRGELLVFRRTDDRTRTSSSRRIPPALPRGPAGAAMDVLSAPSRPLPSPSRRDDDRMTELPHPMAFSSQTSTSGDALRHARALADRGEAPAALRVLDEHLSAHPFEGEAYVLRALLHQQQRRHRHALEDVNRALLLDRANVQAHLVRVASLLALGEHDEVERALRRARRQLDALPPDDEGPRRDLEAAWSSLATIAKRGTP